MFFKKKNAKNCWVLFMNLFQDNQEKVMKAVLGAKSATNYLDSKATKFLARGHLAPDADFALSPHQLATYYYVNAAPQWQSINAGNWLRTETNSRIVAAAVSISRGRRPP